MANTLAYYETATFTVIKSFIVQGPVLQNFYGYNCCYNKLECFETTLHNHLNLNFAYKAGSLNLE